MLKFGCEKYSHLFDKTFENVKEEVQKAFNAKNEEVIEKLSELIVNKIGKGCSTMVSGKTINVEEDGTIISNYHPYVRNTDAPLERFYYTCRLLQLCEVLNIDEGKDEVITDYINFITEKFVKFFTLLKENNVAFLRSSFSEVQIHVIQGIENDKLETLPHWSFRNEKSKLIKKLRIKTKCLIGGSKQVKGTHLDVITTYYSSQQKLYTNSLKVSSIIVDCAGQFLRNIMFIKNKNIIKLLRLAYQEEEREIEEKKIATLDKLNKRKLSQIKSLMPIIS